MRLVTERLVLRDYTMLDLEVEYHNNTDPELFRYMPFGPSTLEGTRDRINQMIEKQNQNPRTDYDVAVTLKKSMVLIGGCARASSNFRDSGIFTQTRCEKL